MFNLKELARKKFTTPLRCKTIYWSRRVRIFTDCGSPKWYWIPRLVRVRYARYWGMLGFRAIFLGREITFSFGEDKNDLYGWFED